MVQGRHSMLTRSRTGLLLEYAREATFAARQAQSLEIPTQAFLDAFLVGVQGNGPSNDSSNDSFLAQEMR